MSLGYVKNFESMIAKLKNEGTSFIYLMNLKLLFLAIKENEFIRLFVCLGKG